MSDLILPYQWAPRPYQQPLWNYLSGGGRRAVALWPRRHGKDDVFLRHTSCAMTERKGTYWYLLPEYAQARKSMWDAIDEETGTRIMDKVFPPAIRTLYREQEMMLGIAGSTFQLVGADNYNSLVGAPPVGLTFSEYARTNPSSWAYLMPILEKNGGWVGFNSTPFGDNHYKQLCTLAAEKQAAGQDWFFEKLTAEGCGVYAPAQLQNILQELQAIHGEDYGRALFLQEYECSFDAAILGSIWGDCLDRCQREGRIGSYPFQPGFPVCTAWDLGFSDDVAIWFYQIIARDIRVFAYHVSNHKNVEFYATLLRDRQRAQDWTYGTHWLPHDARARTLAAGGKSIQQQFLAHAIGRIAIAPRLDHEEGIQAARATFPYCVFDATGCKDGLSALWHYRHEWNDDKKVFTTRPLHNWASHGSSAFRTLSLSWKAPKPSQGPEAPLSARLQAGNPAIQTFGRLKAQHLTRKAAERDLAMMT